MDIEKEYQKQIGERLSRVRISLGMKQNEIASFLDVNPRTYAGYERAERKIPFEILNKLLINKKINLNYIIAGYGEMTLMGEELLNFPFIKKNLNNQNNEEDFAIKVEDILRKNKLI